MHFLFLSNLWVYSAQCRQKVKLNDANVHSNIIVLHEREKDECYNYMGVQFSVGICICQHIISWVFSLVLAYVYVSIYNVILCAYICMFLYVYVFTKGCTFVPLSVCAGGKWGSVVCRRPWMLSRRQLGSAMVHVQCRKRQEQATYKLNGHTLKTSTFPLASSSMSSRVMKQAINTYILLGCQSEQEVQGIFRLIWILTFFRWIVIYIYI